MAVAKDERDSILLLVESGQITATQAAQLLDTLEEEYDVLCERPTGYMRDRTVHIRATNMKSRTQRMRMTGALPVSLMRTGLRLGAQLVPQFYNNEVENLLRALESGTTGRLLDLQDLENGERLEIFID